MSRSQSVAGAFVVCSFCSADNPDSITHCHNCGKLLRPSDELPTSLITTGATRTSTIDRWAAAGAASVNLAIGTVLGGRYELLQLLGEGGMGAVYKALDLELDRVIAIKVIRPGMAKEPTLAMRFKQELLLARQITSRNVIRIYDLEIADDVRFITMEYVEGRELGD